MKTYASTFLLSLVAASVTGCAGLNIRPITKAEDSAAHEGGNSLKGYVIYAPMLVVEITKKTTPCVKEAATKLCKPDSAEVTTCSAGTPFVMPDESKPFLLEASPGFGKAGVDVTIKDGWLLSQVKDTSDNTAVLGTVEKILGSKFGATITNESGNSTCTPGLYRMDLQTKGAEMVFKLLPVLTY